MEKTKTTHEWCPLCEAEVEIPAALGVYECPECGAPITPCSMCETMDCENCEHKAKAEELKAQPSIGGILMAMMSRRCGGTAKAVAPMAELERLLYAYGCKTHRPLTGRQIAQSPCLMDIVNENDGKL